MEIETFSLSSREQVEQFESLFDKYLAQRGQFSLKHLSLLEAYDQLQSRDDGGRVFSALLDLQINFSLLYLDSHAVGATWNNYFSKGKLEGGSILDSEEKFFGKMDVHRFNSSYVLRYRALWDKIMGLLVLIIVPHEYERYVSAKSRKKMFRKIALESNLLPEEAVKSLEELLMKFDNSFRTAEAHGTGSLRKYSFTMESMDKNPQIELIGYWNVVNGFIAEFGKLFPRQNANSV